MAEEKVNQVVMKDLTANPAALGLLGFGITTVLLNISNAGLFPLNSVILSNGYSIWWISTSNGFMDGV